jgi:glycosylphosphatidylinositol transamidase (GPIT) subunit GPI8
MNKNPYSKFLNEKPVVIKQTQKMKDLLQSYFSDRGMSKIDWEKQLKSENPEVIITKLFGVLKNRDEKQEKEIIEQLNNYG